MPSQSGAARPARFAVIATLVTAIAFISAHDRGVTAAADPLRCDFDADGRSDLAIGVPGDNNRRGAVNVQYSTGGFLDKGGYLRRGLNVPGLATFKEELGAALACGDFDGDGFADLAIGIPRENQSRGGVAVVYGSDQGLFDKHGTYLNQDTIGLDAVAPAETSDRFGEALAAGDFDHDGTDDLAIGVPGEDLVTFTADGSVDEHVSDAGEVHVVFGSGKGLSGPAQTFSPLMPGACCFAPGPSAYGSALAVGDFDADDVDDLAIGVPHANFSPGHNQFVPFAGAVHVLHGETGEGLVLDDQVFLNELMVSPKTMPREYELFGHSLAAGQFDGLRGDDLAIGSPYEKFEEKFEGYYGYGAVRIAYFDAAGAVAATRTFVSPPPWPGAPWEQERYGWALAAGDFDGANHDDLAIGAPGSQYPSDQKIAMGGWVQVVFSDAQGLTEKGAHTVFPGDFAHGVQTPAAPVGVGFDFGAALAAGDYQGDGVADLFIGVPLLTLSVEKMGGVEIRPGVPNVGFNLSFLLLTQDTAQPGKTWAAAPSTDTVGERMGYSLGR